jgi:putative PIN family toxin of toxin-antitoxin system
VQKTRTVLDTNVVISGIFWQGEARKCLLALARRKFQIAACPEIIREYRKIAGEIKEETGTEPVHFLDWIESLANIVEPMPTGKLSRDIDDNIFIGCALASSAKYIVTRDVDLLVLKKPFGIEILQPRDFLRKISSP